MHEELEGITKELEKAIKELEKKKFKPDVKADKISHVQDRVQRGKDIYANFRVELRDVLKESGRVAFTEWEGKGHTHHKNMTKFTKDSERLVPDTRRFPSSRSHPKTAGFALFYSLVPGGGNSA